MLIGERKSENKDAAHCEVTGCGPLPWIGFNHLGLFTLNKSES